MEAVTAAQGGSDSICPERVTFPTMLNALRFSTAILLLGVGQLSAQQACVSGTTALVLSGGGAKGLAHVGVLRELERAGIHPDLIVGTSMGAVVGALAASGYSAAEIDSIAHSLPLAEAFRATEPRGPAAWGDRLPLVIWEQGERGFALRSASVEEVGVGAMLNQALLRGNLLARGNFDSLPIPLRVVATNLSDRAVVALAHGDLAQAVRASIAIPLVLSPERIGSSVYVDGGLSANIPIGVARSAGAARVIVSDVTTAVSDTVNPDSPIDVANRLLDWLFHQPSASLGGQDLMIRTPVGGFRTLDFAIPALDSLVALGASAADSALSAWKCRGPLGRERPTVMLPTLVAGIKPASDATPADIAELSTMARVLGVTAPERLDLATLGSRLRSLTDREIFREVWLHPAGGDTVTFRPEVRPLPRRSGGLGISYDGELGGKLWIGVLDRRLPVVAAEGSALLHLNRYSSGMTMAFRRQTLLGRSAMTPVVSLALVGTDVRRFVGDGIEIPATRVLDFTAEAGLEGHPGDGFELQLGAWIASWRERDPIAASELTRNTLGGRVTLAKWSARNRRVARAELILTPEYTRGLLELDLHAATAGFRFEPRVRAGYGRNLPPGRYFNLGGSDGFPGLHLGELPGDNELSVALTIRHRLVGPISLRMSGAVGRTAFGQTSFRDDGGQLLAGPGRHNSGGLLGSEGWLGGGRVGLDTATPLGEIRVEYGVNSLGRSTAFFRVGRW